MGGSEELWLVLGSASDVRATGGIVELRKNSTRLAQVHDAKLERKPAE